MPTTYWTFVIGGAALAGFPLITAGFYSKDEILAQAFAGSTLFVILGVLGLITAFLTAFYTFRAVYMTFHGNPKDRLLFDHAHESKSVITVPLVILAGLSIVGGFIGLPANLGLPNWLEGWLEPVFETMIAVTGGELHHLAVGTEIFLLLLSSLLALGGIFLAYHVYVRNPQIAERTAQSFGSVYNLLTHKYYVDEIYDAVFVNSGKRFARFLANIIDVGLIDTVLVDGSAWFVGALGRISSGFQTGYLRNYVTAIFIGGIIISLYFFLS